jgi:hypothetical protein
MEPSMQSFLELIFQSDALRSAVTDITWSYSAVAGTLGIGIFFINTIFNYGRNVMNSIGKDGKVKFFDPGEIIRGFIILVFIGSYVPAMSLLDWFGDQLNYETIYSDSLVKQGQAAMQEYMRSGESSGEAQSSGNVNGEEQGEGMSYSIWNILSGLISPTNLLSGWSLSMTKIILAVVRYVIQAVAMGMQKVLFVIGPFAFALSLLPGRQGILGSWFGTYLTCIMVGVVCNVLDAVVMASMAALDASVYAGKWVNPIAFSSLNCVIIVMYCLAFWLAGKLVNAADAGKVLSTAVSVASTLATQGTGLLSKLGGKAAGGKGGDIIAGN